MPDNQMCFNLHSLTYSAGDWIKGEINLKIETELLSDHLYLKFKGIEKVTQNNSAPIKIQHTIFDYNLKIHEWPNGKISPGDYVFPFEVYLPKDIPSSTSISTHSLEINLSYSLKAYLDNSLSSSSPISVQSYQDFPTSLNKTDTIFDLKSCFCFKRKTIEFVASIKKYAYNCNEIVKLHIEGICESMPNVEILLVRNLMANINGNVIVEKDNLFKITTNLTCIDIDLKAFEGRLKLQTTSRGKNFSCSYCFVIIGITDATCFREIPEIQLWVVINPVNTAPSIPRYHGAWRPKRMHSSRFEDNNINIEN